MAIILMPLSIQSATTYSTGVGTVEFNGKCKDNRPRNKDDHFKAIERLKRRPGTNIQGSLVRKNE